MIILFIIISLLFSPSTLWAENEVLPETNSTVLVREHPKTGDPFISIVSSDGLPREDLVFESKEKFSRPDYRLLDPKINPKDIGYDGPYSSKTKIYILAASLASLGAAGGLAAAAAIPAAGTAAGSGAGLGIGVGTVAAGGAATAAAVIKIDSEIPDDYRRIQKSELLETETDFYRMHIKPHKREI